MRGYSTLPQRNAARDGTLATGCQRAHESRTIGGRYVVIIHFVQRGSFRLVLVTFEHMNLSRTLQLVAGEAGETAERYAAGRVKVGVGRGWEGGSESGGKNLSGKVGAGHAEQAGEGSREAGIMRDLRVHLFMVGAFSPLNTSPLPNRNNCSCRSPRCALPLTIASGAAANRR